MERSKWLNDRWQVPEKQTEVIKNKDVRTLHTQRNGHIYTKTDAFAKGGVIDEICWLFTEKLQHVS